ncbi:hypothetical protein DFH07DRAFT_281155 [Mycena maculata]|uniref:Uncharacterized protein n=1 Tax=Mycena maculata TaxID=230809 RepID=A0AAD7NQ07_9AGAR|nr:hypothetical protein DFH07DRAFT_281155 [Mycena maculata]
MTHDRHFSHTPRHFLPFLNSGVSALHNLFLRICPPWFLPAPLISANTRNLSPPSVFVPSSATHSPNFYVQCAAQTSFSAQFVRFRVDCFRNPPKQHAKPTGRCRSLPVALFSCAACGLGRPTRPTIRITRAIRLRRRLRTCRCTGTGTHQSIDGDPRIVHRNLSAFSSTGEQTPSTPSVHGGRILSVFPGPPLPLPVPCLVPLSIIFSTRFPIVDLRRQN